MWPLMVDNYFGKREETRSISFAKSVDHPAIATYLSFPPGEDSNTAHLHHGRSKLALEDLRVARQQSHLRRRGGRRHQRLVRREQTTVLQDALVVAGVEDEGARWIHVHLVVAPRRALLLQLGGVARVQGRVTARTPAEVVQPVGERGAVRNANGMCSYI